MLGVLNDDDAKIKFALRTLEQWEDRWLMVFDNCDDPASFIDVEQFIPQGMSFTKIALRAADFLRGQRRHPDYQSPSRLNGAWHYH